MNLDSTELMCRFHKQFSQIKFGIKIYLMYDECAYTLFLFQSLPIKNTTSIFNMLNNMLV